MAGLLVWLFIFARVQAAAGRDAAVATANALRLQSIERTLHIDIVPAANAWLADHVALSHAAVYVYRLYYVAVLGVLVWVYVRHADVYRPVRRTMIAMTALVLPVYFAVPLSPPRYAMPGVVDILALYDIVDTGAPNHYTAMPSMHVGWSLWCAYAVWTALRRTRPRLALLAWAFPALMIAIVIGTGNHYVLDVVGSVLLLAAAVLASSGWAGVVGSRVKVPAV